MASPRRSSLTRSGYDTWWMVEHHCTPEFSYCCTPELMNAVLTQRTERIHLGHSGVLSPFKINHPLRVAERAAVLDVLSGGRAEIALARSGGAEWDTFGIDPETTLDELDEAYKICVKAWTEDEFSWDSPYVTIPPRTLVPKPLQDPHPRLWQTVSTPASFAMAGERGVGALATTLLSTVDTIAMLLAEYDAGLARSPGPVGKFVNSAEGRVHVRALRRDHRRGDRQPGERGGAVVRQRRSEGVLRAEDVWTEMIRGEPTTSTDPGRAQSVSNVDDVMVDMDPDDPHPIVRIMNRQALGYELDPVEVYEALEPLDSVIVGDVETCRRKIRKYADAGVDRLMCLMQYGSLSHERVMSSMRLVGEGFIPEFAPATDRGRRLTVRSPPPG